MKADENRLMRRSVEVAIGWLSALLFVVGQLAVVAPVEAGASFGGSEEAPELSSPGEHLPVSSISSDSSGDATARALPNVIGVEAFAADLSAEATVLHSAGSISILDYAPKLPPPSRFGRS